MLKAVIIEDVTDDYEVLAGLILNYFPEQIRLVGTADTIESAMLLLDQKRPDLVFLDVELGTALGTALFERSAALREAKIIFTTGHSKYVEQAFDMNAVDYILKPIGPDRFKKTVERALNFQKLPDDALQQLVKMLSPNAVDINPRIVLRSQRESLFIRLKDVLMAEADGTCCRIWFIQPDGRIKEFLSSSNLGDYKKLWAPYPYMYWISRAYIANLFHAQRITKAGDPVLHLSHGREVSIPDGKIREVEQAILNVQ